jgi:hypothetical protein
LFFKYDNLEDGEDEDDAEDDADATEDKVVSKRKDSLGSDTSSTNEKKLQNQFSFVERATQTMNNALKVHLKQD